MATVYLADDLRHGREVAIKVLKAELGLLLGPDRFAREIRVAAALNHPHILPLYDSGRMPEGGPEGGRLFYVMPFVRGGSLRERLTRERQLPVDVAVGLVRQVALALDHAHAHGLVHRDIKPENILLHEGEAMVTDFGIALAAATEPGERLTETGLLIGTPDYMSPEQATGERTLDARSDVYSLGCVLYELLAGEPPHASASARSVIARRLTEPAPRVRRARPAGAGGGRRGARAGAGRRSRRARSRPPRRSPMRSRGNDRGARAAAAVGRRAAVRQPERRPRERVLRRRHHRGRDRPALEDPLAQGDRARLGDEVQGARPEPARDRRDAGRGDPARGQRPPGREPRPHRRPSSSTPRRTGTSGPRPTTAS